MGPSGTPTEALSVPLNKQASVEAAVMSAVRDWAAGYDTLPKLIGSIHEVRRRPLTPALFFRWRIFPALTLTPLDGTRRVTLAQLQSFGSPVGSTAYKSVSGKSKRVQILPHVSPIQVDEQPSEAEMKKAFNRAVRAVHPDKLVGKPARVILTESRPPFSPDLRVAVRCLRANRMFARCF